MNRPPGASPRQSTVESPTLAARSVLASTLLGTEPARLPVSRLVRVGALFGFSDGTVRTALSRMAAAGELNREPNGWYSLAGSLAARQQRQSASRSAATVEWSGRWRQAVVVNGARSAPVRAALRDAARLLRLGELREGVWMRPDNLDSDRVPDARATVDGQCRWFVVHPDSDVDLTTILWDLDEWSAGAVDLRRRMAQLAGSLEAGDPASLAPGFVLSAAVLRHFNADPLLPRELLPRRWPGDALRADYDRYDASFRRLLLPYLDGSLDGSIPDRPLSMPS